MNLKQQRAALVKQALDITTTATVEKRDLTADEAKSVEDLFGQIETIDAQIKAAAESDALMAKINSLGPVKSNDDDGEQRAKSLGDHFVKSIGTDGLARLKVRGGSVSAPEFKANTDPQATPASLGPVLTQVESGITREYRRATVSDLLGVGSLGPGKNAVTYFVEGGVEGNFATVAAGGQKPQIHFTDPIARTDAAKKIAAWWDTHDEMIDDAAFWSSEINNRGLYLLSLVEESQLLNGDGTGSNLLGLTQRSGVQSIAQAATDDAAEDAIYRALTAVQTATGLVADGIVINPIDYQALRLKRDGNSQFYGGGFFSGLYGVGGVEFQPPLWGVRTVVTAAVAPKTVLVGAFKAASTVYRLGGVRVESTNSDQGKFTKDIVTTRIEERLALKVQIPSAIAVTTLQ